MKNIVKKMIKVTLGCVLIAQIVQPAIAQPFQDFDPDRTGSITIHRFAGSTATTPTMGTPLNGIPYRVELVRLIPGTAQTAENLRNPDNFEPITGAAAFYAENVTINGVASFPDLPQGIFLVTESEHAITPESDRVAPFIVGIPRRVANENNEYEWIYDVDVYPKAEEDTTVAFDKQLELRWDETLGEMVAHWELEAVIPRLIGNATRFEFIDPLDDRLTLMPGSVVGVYRTIQNIEGSPVETEASLPESAFTYSVDENNNLSIALTPSGFIHLSTYAILAPGTIIFGFSTRISTEEEDLGPITNSANLYYNEDEPIYTETPPPVSYHFAMEVEKIDVNGDRLSEATFEVFLDADATEPAFPVAGGNRQFTTTNGVVFIPALQAGIFYLQEVEAPEGYLLITDTMRVVIGEEQVNPDRPFVITLQVVNEVEGGFVLPETGGAGTLIFTAAGLALVGGAITLALAAKRRREMND